MHSHEHHSFSTAVDIIFKEPAYAAAIKSRAPARSAHRHSTRLFQPKDQRKIASVQTQYCTVGVVLLSLLWVSLLLPMTTETTRVVQ